MTTTYQERARAILAEWRELDNIDSDFIWRADLARKWLDEIGLDYGSAPVRNARMWLTALIEVCDDDDGDDATMAATADAAHAALTRLASGSVFP
jgi:hypothetical protein